MELFSGNVRGWRCDNDGREFLLAILLFRSRLVEEPGLTRIEGVRLMGLSDLESKNNASISELGGRDLTRDDGLEPVDEESKF